MSKEFANEMIELEYELEVNPDQVLLIKRLANIYKVLFFSPSILKNNIKKDKT